MRSGSVLHLCVLQDYFNCISFFLLLRNHYLLPHITEPYYFNLNSSIIHSPQPCFRVLLHTFRGFLPCAFAPFFPAYCRKCDVTCLTKKACNSKYQNFEIKTGKARSCYPPLSQFCSDLRHLECLPCISAWATCFSKSRIHPPTFTIQAPSGSSHPGTAQVSVLIPFPTTPPRTNNLSKDTKTLRVL